MYIYLHIDRFLRNENGHKKHVTAATSNNKPTSETNKPSTNTSSVTTNSNSKSFGSSFFSRSNSKASKGMTPDERQARRDMILKAAKDREQAWDKKVAGGRKISQASDSKVDMNGRPIFDHSVAASIGSSNPETQRRVEEIRKAEEKQAQVFLSPYCIRNE